MLLDDLVDGAFGTHGLQRRVDAQASGGELCAVALLAAQQAVRQAAFALQLMHQRLDAQAEADLGTGRPGVAECLRAAVHGQAGHRQQQADGHGDDHRHPAPDAAPAGQRTATGRRSVAGRCAVDCDRSEPAVPPAVRSDSSRSGRLRSRQPPYRQPPGRHTLVATDPRRRQRPADTTLADFTESDDPVEQRPQTRPHPHVTTLVRLPQRPVSDLLEPVGTWVACPSHRRPGASDRHPGGERGEMWPVRLL